MAFVQRVVTAGEFDAADAKAVQRILFNHGSISFIE
jgi:hypothetical protein